MAAPTPSRITVIPSQHMLDTLERRWPMNVPRYRLARIALERGLDDLARLAPDEFRRVITEEAVASAGITANP
jgi:hypothetical protein